MNSCPGRIAFRLIPIVALSMLSACAGRSLWTFSIDKVGPTYVPAIEMNGVVQRVVALTITGSPELITPLMQRAQAEGWKARMLGDDCIQIDPVGHSLDEVTALSFRVNNGEFGDLKFNIIMRPDKKANG
jgi:hypothetical protein